MTSSQQKHSKDSSFEVPNLPRIIISAVAKQKIDTWVDLSPVEISGLGTVQYLGDNTFYIDKVYLPKQVNSASDTTLDPEGIADLMFQLNQEGNDDEDRLHFWWHSHHTMDVFWSGTDENAIANDIGGDKFLISTVFNKKGKSKTRYDVFKPMQVTLDNLELEVHHPKYDGIEDFCKEEYEKKCTRSYTSHGGKNYGNGRYSHHNKWDRSSHRTEKKHEAAMTEKDYEELFNSDEYEDAWRMYD